MIGFLTSYDLNSNIETGFPNYSTNGRSHIPVLYALLEDKHKTSYQTVLQWLHIRCPLLDPTLILTDLEKAELWSSKRVYPSTRIQGCNSHFNQLQLRQFRMISDYALQ